MKIKQYKTTKGKKNVTAFYNENFNWKVVLPTVVYNYLIQKIEEQSPFKGFKIDTALYYLSLVMSIPAAHKDKIYKYGFVPLNSTLLQKKYYRYNKYFEYFLNINILEQINYSTNSNNCKSYRYNFEIINSESLENLECIDFETFEIGDKKLNEKILDENTCNDSFVSCQHLCKCFNSKLQIDFKGLINCLRSEFCYDKNSLKYDYHSTITKAYNYWYSALTLRDQCFRTSRKPESDNRLHTNLTNMPSKFRQFIKYDYEDIVSLDISNSQPYFMVLLLEKYKNKRIRKIIRNIFGNRMGIILKELKKITTNNEFQNEFSEIKQSILSGTFYEFLGDIFEHIQPFDFTLDISGTKTEWYQGKFYNADIRKSEILMFEGKRNLMKKLTLQILYTPLKRPSKEYIFFKQRFPLLCNCIEVFKTQSYKDFPKLLQHIEADCILDVISNKLATKYPEMPLWTIHDSICTTIKHFDIMQRTVKDLFLSYSEDLAPCFKVECWTEEKNCLKVA